MPGCRRSNGTNHTVPGQPLEMLCAFGESGVGPQLLPHHTIASIFPPSLSGLFPRRLSRFEICTFSIFPRMRMRKESRVYGMSSENVTRGRYPPVLRSGLPGYRLGHTVKLWFHRKRDGHYKYSRDKIAVFR